MYGLLAEAIYVEPDFSAASFRLRPGLRFNNGDPVTVDDVVHSFKTLSTTGASPTYQTLLAGVEKCESVDARTVRVRFPAVGFDALVRALEPVLGSTGARVTEFSAAAIADAGMVRAELLVAR